MYLCCFDFGIDSLMFGPHTINIDQYMFSDAQIMINNVDF